MPKFKLSLKPVQEAVWVTHEPSGARFRVAPLLADEDDRLTREHSDLMGNVNALSFAKEAAPLVIRGWEGVGGPEGEMPCNAENIKLFIASHGLTIFPWILRKSRGLDHYREQEIEASKND